MENITTDDITMDNQQLKEIFNDYKVTPTNNK